jgi:hypothetical protein
MPEWMELVKLLTLAVVVPLVVFMANWAWRFEKGYSQTAAADFILAMLIFDISAVLASKDFVPFMRAPSLIPLITYWHFLVACLSCSAWWGIAKWGEPVLEGYYDRKAGSGKRFPFGPFFLCWFAVLTLVALHVGFFAIGQV